MVETILAISATIFLALLGWLIRGLLAWGHTIGEVKAEMAELSKKAVATASDVADIRSKMLSPSDLENAVLKLKLEVLRGALGTNVRTTDKT